MSGFKASKYNFYFTLLDGTKCIFNSLSNGALEFKSNNEFRKIKKIIDAPNTFPPESDMVKLALKYNFILPEEISEEQIIKVNARHLAFDTRTLSLSIFVTRRCNFKCIYCYQGEHPSGIDSDMDKETMEHLIKFVKRSIKDVSGLEITWYGGEPTLVWEKIRYLSQNFIEICEQNLSLYIAGLITNGYLLTPEKSKELLNMGIKMVQITLDGPPNVHNERRPLLSGGTTFKRIFENLSQIPPEIRIELRVNVDELNYKRVPELFNYLYDYRKRIKMVFTPVSSIGKGSRDYKFCYNVEQFPKLWGKLMIESLQKGFNVTYDFPPVRSSLCDFRKFNTWDIDYNGDLYKCPLQVGDPKYRMGFINEEGKIQITNMPLYLEALSYDPFDAKACESCRFLPMCSTHCKLASDLFGDPIVPEKCLNWPILLEQMLEIQHYKKKKNLLEQRRRDERSH